MKRDSKDTTLHVDHTGAKYRTSNGKLVNAFFRFNEM